MIIFNFKKQVLVITSVRKNHLHKGPQNQYIIFNVELNELMLFIEELCMMKNKIS